MQASRRDEQVVEAELSDQEEVFSKRLFWGKNDLNKCFVKFPFIILSSQKGGDLFRCKQLCILTHIFVIKYLHLQRGGKFGLVRSASAQSTTSREATCLHVDSTFYKLIKFYFSIYRPFSINLRPATGLPKQGMSPPLNILPLVRLCGYLMLKRCS